VFKKLRRLSGRVKNLRIVLNPKAIVAWGKFRTLKKRAAAYEAYTLRLNESVSQTTKMLFEALNGAKEPDARGISDGIHSIEVDIAEARERITNLINEARDVHNRAKAIGWEKVQEQVEEIAIDLGKFKGNLDLALLEPLENYKKTLKDQGITVD